MALLHITIDMPEEDSQLEAMDAGEYLVYIYNMEREKRKFPQARFVSAEWEPNADISEVIWRAAHPEDIGW